MTIADMSSYGTVHDTSEYVSAQAHSDVFKGQLVAAGTILMSFKLTIGRMSRLAVPAYHNEAIISFRTIDPDVVTDAYLFYALGQVEFSKYQDTAIKGQTLNKAKIESITLDLPSVPVQDQIVEILDSAHGAIAAQEDLSSQLMELRRAAAFDFLQPVASGEAADRALVPTKLEACSVVSSGRMPYGEFAASDDCTDGIECMAIKVSDMNLLGNERALIRSNLVRRLPAEVAERRLIPPGSVVFPKRGAAIATNKKRMTTTWTALDPNLIAVTPNPGLDVNYLYNWLLTIDLKTITSDGPTPQLNKKDVLPLEIPIPESSEAQADVCSILSGIDAKYDHHTQRGALLAELFSSLANRLVSGDLQPI